MNNTTTANILGVLGAVCWSIQLIPQIIINYRRHDTTGLQPGMMMLWASAGAPLAIYNVVQNFNIALQIQPQILTSLSLITWTQCYYYGKKWPIHNCLMLVALILCFMAGVEAAMIVALRIGAARGVEWPSTIMAGLAGFLLCAGVATHYRDIYKSRSVRGISFLFVGIDAAGDIFSLASVIFEPSLNIAGMVVYAAEFTLWSGVFACGFWLNLLPWLKQKYKPRNENHNTDTQAFPPAAATPTAAADTHVESQQDGRLEALTLPAITIRRESAASHPTASILSNASTTSRASVFYTVSGELRTRGLRRPSSN